MEALQKKVSDYNDGKSEKNAGVSKVYKDNFIEGCYITSKKSISAQRANAYCECMFISLSRGIDSDEDMEEMLSKIPKEELQEKQVSCLDKPFGWF